MSSDIKKLEEENENLRVEFQSAEKTIISKEGEINLLKIQAEKRDEEIKRLIERAEAAERELELKSKKEK